MSFAIQGRKLREATKIVTVTDLTPVLPGPYPISNEDVAQAMAAAPPTTWVVPDDDPTGTQSVRDLPVLTSHSAEDFAWAFGTESPAIYVQTNARSLDPVAAAHVMAEVVANALDGASELGRVLEFISRTDSTLRGHFPLDIDTIRQAEAEREVGATTSSRQVIMVPAFPEAGRVTVDGIHYVRNKDREMVPAAQSDYALDATFGYQSSDLREWVNEKSNGAVRADEVVHIPLETVRKGPSAVAEVLATAPNDSYVVPDIVVEEDLLVIAAATHARRQDGAQFIYRVGPPFVRGLIAQGLSAPLTDDELQTLQESRPEPGAPGGIIVVGSHVPTTTRQLAELRKTQNPAEVELDVPALLSARGKGHIEDLVRDVTRGIAKGNVVLSTSRTLQEGNDKDESLRIATRVSDALVDIVRGVLGAVAPRFVIAKGGITSSDIATRALRIRRAVVRGPMLPGIVSLWEAVEKPAEHLPYVVFAGNVGDDDSLNQVVAKLSIQQE